MRIDSLKLIYFSPTETTRKLVSAIAQGFPSTQVDHLNLTMPESASRDFANSSDGLAIIGMPVYGGRLPAEAVARLRRINGNSTPAVVVVLYGNRAYDDAEGKHLLSTVNCSKMGIYNFKNDETSQ